MARPTIRLTVGMGAVPATGTDIGAMLHGTTGLIRSITCRRGRQRTLDTVQPGSLTVTLDNSLREFDPFNTAGPFTAGGVSQLKPGPFIQVAATGSTIGASVLGLFSGFLTDLPVTWDVGEVATAQWTAVEALIALGRVNPIAGASVGDSELSGARIGRVLTNASWPAAVSAFPPFGASRNIDGGTANMQATTLGTNALQEAQLVATTERGDLFTSGLGVMTFRDRGYRFKQMNAATSATFGDGGGSEIPFVEGSLTVGNNSDLYRNTARIAGSGLTPQVSSVAGPYISDFTQTSLLLRSDADAASYASWITTAYSSGDLRFESLTVEPTDDDANWTTLLGLDIGMRVTVKVRPPGSNAGVVTRECFIEGIEHTIPPEGVGAWSIKFLFGDATAFVGTWFILDDATFGKLDSGNKITF